MKNLSLTQIIRSMSKQGKLTPEQKDKIEKNIKDYQLMMLRIQQAVYHRKDRVVIIFEGFDASGKGGCIRTITEVLDPRGFKVIPIGPPDPVEQGTHWLYRFWKDLPPPGQITIFDRSWYGRVMVEKVESLTSKERINQAYAEIKEFENQLQNDGIILMKFFMGITKEEQYERFMARIEDPYKQWKLTMADIEAREKWNEYVKAVNTLLTKTSTTKCPWHLIPANSKKFARREVLKTLTTKFSFWRNWMEEMAKGNKQKAKLIKLLEKS